MRPLRLYQKSSLLPGLDLIIERHPGALSSAVGVFIGCGSRHDPEPISGASHLIEHLLFKGTTTRSAEELSREIESCGGDLNAFTEREYTCIHAWVPRAHTRRSLELLFEMLFDSVFDAQEFKKERDVVVQELQTYEESPEDEFWDRLLEVPWGTHPLGRRIGGLSSQVRRYTHQDVIDFFENRFLRAPLSVVIATSLDPETLVRGLRQTLRAKAKNYLWGRRLLARGRKPLGGRAAKKPKTASAPVRSSRLDAFAPSDQVQLGLMLPAPTSFSASDEILWSAATILLGGGSSSRLFREVREERGLAYNVSASLHSFSDTALVIGHLVTDRARLLEALRVMGSVYRDFAQGPRPDEMPFLKSLLEGSLALSSEGVMNRVEILGRQKMLLGRALTWREAQRELRLVKAPALEKVCRHFAQVPCFYGLGRVSGRDKNALLRAWKGES